MTGVADYAPWLSTWSGGQWVSLSLPDAKTGTAVDYPDYRVALRGALEIGLLHGPCFDTQPHSLIWVTSVDGGATWGAPERVKGCFNEEATVGWSDAGDVVVLSGGGDGTPCVADPECRRSPSPVWCSVQSVGWGRLGPW